MNARRGFLAALFAFLGVLAIRSVVTQFRTTEPPSDPSVGFIAGTRSEAAPLRSDESASPVHDESSSALRNVPDPPEGDSAQGQALADLTQLADLAPDSRQVLEEARENPHQTPQSLIDFAHRLAGPMERAQKSEKDALPVFGQMENCASDPLGAQPIQARVVCMANAARLAELYPAPLTARYLVLARANPLLTSILETTGL